MEFETLFKRNEMKIAFEMVCVCSRKAKMPIIHLADCKKWRNEPTNKEKNVKNQIENEKKNTEREKKNHFSCHVTYHVHSKFMATIMFRIDKYAVVLLPKNVQWGS